MLEGWKHNFVIFQYLEWNEVCTEKQEQFTYISPAFPYSLSHFPFYFEIWMPNHSNPIPVTRTQYQTTACELACLPTVKLELNYYLNRSCIYSSKIKSAIKVLFIILFLCIESWFQCFPTNFSVAILVACRSSVACNKKKRCVSIGLLSFVLFPIGIASNSNYIPARNSVICEKYQNPEIRGIHWLSPLVTIRDYYYAKSRMHHRSPIAETLGFDLCVVSENIEWTTKIPMHFVTHMPEETPMGYLCL